MSYLLRDQDSESLSEVIQIGYWEDLEFENRVTNSSTIAMAQLGHDSLERQKPDHDCMRNEEDFQATLKGRFAFLPMKLKRRRDKQKIDSLKAEIAELEGVLSKLQQQTKPFDAALSENAKLNALMWKSGAAQECQVRARAERRNSRLKKSISVHMAYSNSLSHALCEWHTWGDMSVSSTYQV